MSALHRVAFWACVAFLALLVLGPNLLALTETGTLILVGSEKGLVVEPVVVEGVALGVLRDRLIVDARTHLRATVHANLRHRNVVGFAHDCAPAMSAKCARAIKRCNRTWSAPSNANNS